MGTRWTKKEEKIFKNELTKLYVKENFSIKEIALELNLAQSTVFDRLVRLKIKTKPHLKSGYLNKRSDIFIPHKHSGELAEFIGIMLGDGHISHFQVLVTLGSKEENYVNYIVGLINKIFKVKPKVSIKKNGYRDVYLGSVELTSWLEKQGLKSHKVKNQVGVPKWIFDDNVFLKSYLRGFFDTDGSVYKLRHGIQISFTNYSKNLLNFTRTALKKLNYSPSEISSNKVYLTRFSDVKRFFKEIKPKNLKHRARYVNIMDIMRRSYSGNYTRL